MGGTLGDGPAADTWGRRPVSSGDTGPHPPRPGWSAPRRAHGLDAAPGGASTSRLCAWAQLQDDRDRPGRQTQVWERGPGTSRQRGGQTHGHNHTCGGLQTDKRMMRKTHGGTEMEHSGERQGDRQRDGDTWTHRYGHTDTQTHGHTVGTRENTWTHGHGHTVETREYTRTHSGIMGTHTDTQTHRYTDTQWKRGNTHGHTDIWTNGHTAGTDVERKSETERKSESIRAPRARPSLRGRRGRLGSSCMLGPNVGPMSRHRELVRS